MGHDLFLTLAREATALLFFAIAIKQYDMAKCRQIVINNLI
jgi:hypothetical protein